MKLRRVITQPLVLMAFGAGLMLTLIIVPTFFSSTHAPGLICRPNAANAQEECSELQTMVIDLELTADAAYWEINSYQLQEDFRASQYYEYATSVAIYKEDADIPNQCGNDVPHRLWVGAEGEVLGPEPSNLRAAPGGDVLYEIYEGDRFRVVAGPSCLNNITYWYVMLRTMPHQWITGWVSEGNRGDYFLVPLDWERNPIENPAEFDSGLEYAPGMACPYVYTINPVNGEWEFESTILTYLDGSTLEGQQRVALQNFDGRLRIAEEEPETSYLDWLVVEVVDVQGQTHQLVPDVHELQSADDTYFILTRGDELILEFASFSAIGQIQSASVIAEGYYVPSNRP